jgi:hypothetical protein
MFDPIPLVGHLRNGGNNFRLSYVCCYLADLVPFEQIQVNQLVGHYAVWQQLLSGHCYVVHIGSMQLVGHLRNGGTISCDAG